MEVTPSYTKEQDGVAERYNRTLGEWEKTNLHQSGLPMSFWAEAQMYSEFILRRCYSGATGEIPGQAWNRARLDPLPTSQTNVFMCRPFGCEAFIHIPKEQRRKGDFKARRGVFIGYSFDQGTYAHRIWDPTLRRIILS